ncbi:MAG: sugar transferase [Marinirhabdus sp.]|nr:sugar transferase [Marinirhabdus sp.]
MAAVLLLVISPIFLGLVIVLTLALKGNPFFTQLRPGKDEKIFRIIKFRTMSNQRDAEGKLLPDKDRLSGFGKLVRSTSLDEIPQLINVVIGDMSMVGPRPLLPAYLPLYNKAQRKRHDVKPGITGWAQVNGRNAISWQSKFEMDVYYATHLNFALDLKILVKTLIKVIKRTDIRSDQSVTAEPFKGNDV